MKHHSTDRIRTNGTNIIHIDQHRHSKNPLGKYAELHRSFLQTYHPSFYNRLMALGKLNEWLHAIDEIADRRFEVAQKSAIRHAKSKTHCSQK